MLITHLKPCRTFVVVWCSISSILFSLIYFNRKTSRREKVFDRIFIFKKNLTANILLDIRAGLGLERISIIISRISCRTSS